MTDPLDLDAIEALLAAATPGPWEARADRDKKAAARNWRGIYAPADRRPVVIEDYYEGHAMGETFTASGVRIREPDARLIAAAPTLLGALVARVRELEAERDELRATLANERGEGEPPGEGWEFRIPDLTGWRTQDDAEYRRWCKGDLIVYRDDRNTWSIARRAVRVSGFHPTARAAMRATDTPTGGSDAR